ncbi:MAG: hypothetical protein HUU50_01415 [Candidatus Brocadiae bacterium]|nr:hypothetical protein [Candidatus Brocadiia bacterium]
MSLGENSTNTNHTLPEKEEISFSLVTQPEEAINSGWLQFPADDALLCEIAQTRHNPFSLIAADNMSREAVWESNIHNINKACREELMGAIQRMFHSVQKNDEGGNEWIVLVGSAGSGKTHLLRFLEKPVQEMGAFYLNFRPFVGKGSVVYYLVRNLLDELRSRSFLNEDYPALLSMAMPLFTTTIQQVCQSGDPEWASRLFLKPNGFFSRFDNSNTNCLDVQKKAQNPEELIPLLQNRFDIEKIVNETLHTYRVSLTSGSIPSKAFQQLLKLALCRPGKESDIAFESMFALDRSEENEIGPGQEDVIQYQDDRLKALLALISLSRKVICLSMDQFEETLTRLKERHIDSARYDGILASFFTDLAKLFNYGKGTALFFSCQLNDWMDISRRLPAQVQRRIKPPVNLISPSEADLFSLVEKRLRLFWKEKKFSIPEHPEMIFPFTKKELRDLCFRKENPTVAQDTLGNILKILGTLFDERMQEVREGRNVHFFLHRAEIIQREKEEAEKKRATEIEEQKEIALKEKKRQEELKEEISKLESLKNQNLEELQKLEKEKQDLLRKEQSIEAQQQTTQQQWEEKKKALIEKEKKLIDREHSQLEQEKKLLEKEKCLLQQEMDIAEFTEKIKAWQKERKDWEEKEKDWQEKEKAWHKERFSYEEEKKNLLKIIEDLKEKLKKVDRSHIPNNYERIFNTHTIPIVKVRQYMGSHGCEVASTGRQNTLDEMYDALNHEEIMECIEINCTLSDLRALCSRYNLPTYGTKKDLINRILES